MDRALRADAVAAQHQDAAGDRLVGVGETPGEFAADLAEAAARLDAFVAAARGARWPPHPIFGRLSPAAWLRWGYLHTDHHLRQFGH